MVGEVDAGPSTLEVPTDVDLSEEAVTRAAEAQEKVLVLRDCTMEFGGVVAMDDVSIEVHKGQIFGIIGPNGAGKTTLFNCVTGVYRPTAGRDRARRPSRSSASKPHHITVGRRRPHVPEHPAVPEHDRGREHHGGRRRPARDERPRRAAQQPAVLPGGAPRQGRGDSPARVRRHPATAPSRPPATCPTATSAGSRSPGRSPPSPRSCSSTSRRPASTRPRSRRSSASSARSATAGSPWSSSSTTWAW